MTQGKLFRIAVFTDDPSGGNPAGVWLGDELPDAATMQVIAADVGYSETAFVAPLVGTERTVRYFTPEVEVPFCGHATIAAGFVLGDGGKTTYRFQTPAGEVPVTVTEQADEVFVSLVSVEPAQKPAPAELTAAVLDAFGWDRYDLDATIPPVLAFAGIWHLVLAVSTRERLAYPDYDYETLKSLMQQYDLATLQLVWRESDTLYHSRNPAPAVGIVEDPATGSAAAALGGYLRDGGFRAAPPRIEVRQGEDMGRPSQLFVEIPHTGGIVVSGTAVTLHEPLSCGKYGR
jgi:PhzF family phenazine biosynthesis protein